MFNLTLPGSIPQYLNHCFRSALGFQLVALIGLILTPGPAVADTAKGEAHATSYVKQRDIGLVNDLHSLADTSDRVSLLAGSEYPVRDEHPLGADETPAISKETVEPITRKLPFWGEKVRAMGYNLPLPFGVGANFIYMEQGIEIRNLKVDIRGTNIDVSGVTFSNASAHDAAATARLDLWLLPFANVYGIFGYINGEAELDVNLPSLIVDLPIIGPTPITDPKRIKFNIDYNGTTVGGGVTLAGGYKDFFGSLDVNYTQSNIDVVDGEIKTLTVSPRLGVLVDPAAIKGSLALWVGLGLYLLC